MSILRGLWEHRESRTITPNQLWAMGRDEYLSARSDAGVNVTDMDATGLGAVFACRALISETIATLPVDMFINLPNGQGQKPYRINGGRAWMDAPVPRDPSITMVDHVAQVVMSIVSAGDSFTVCMPSVADPQELRVLPKPRSVEVKRGPDGAPTYGWHNEQNQWVTAGPDRIVHIARLRRPGGLRGMDPVEEARQSIGLGLAAQRQAGLWFRNGTLLSGYIKTPEKVNAVDAKALRDGFDADHSGDNRFRVGVLTGGAEYEALSVTPEQAQFLESRKFQVEEIARWFRVPVHLIQVNEPGSVSYASVEQTAVEFEKYTIRPYLELIEAAYTRLVPYGNTFIKFNTNGLLRGDVKSRYEAYGAGLDKGFLVRNEVRAWEDLPPLKKGGDIATVQSQNIDLATVGGVPAPAPVAGPPPATGGTAMPPTGRSMEERATSLEEITALAAALPAPVVNVPPFPTPVFNLPAPMVTVNVPEQPVPVVNVTVPEQAAPVVNVAAPVVNVAAPEVSVDAPVVNVPAAVVNVPAPIVTIEAPPRTTTTTVERDRNGRITGTTSVET